MNCPNCGYCPHCGRGSEPRRSPSPYAPDFIEQTRKDIDFQKKMQEFLQRPQLGDPTYR